jgi:hypothetical protein
MKKMYQIQYHDQTYRIVKWTDEEFDKVKTCMQGEFTVCALSDSVFKLTDIRAIVLVPAVETEEVAEDGKGTGEWDFVDDATAAWLKANGMDIGGRG